MPNSFLSHLRYISLLCSFIWVECLVFFAVVLRVPLEGQSCILCIKELFDSFFHQASSLNGQNLENAD